MIQNSSISDSPQSLGVALKVCLFATGCAAIVAEYTLATLASYLIGNAIIQWTLVISLMLFSMGLGSRATRNIKEKLLDRYIAVEYVLSLLCAFSAIFCYSAAAFTQNIGIVVYGSACMIGFFTGMELPLITRVNNNYQPLRDNIASVMEYDYYGALIGGGLFAFLLLPFLGLTYTPILLGTINLLVAGLILWKFSSFLTQPKIFGVGFVISLTLVIIASISAKPIVLYGEQSKYRDPIVYEEQTRYQKIVITKWKNNYWLFLNGSEQFSTYDEERYHEPLIHPAMTLAKERKQILVLGGGDGLAVREILKYSKVQSIDLVDLDPAITKLAQTHKIFLNVNKSSLLNPKVNVVNQDAYHYVNQIEKLFDVIVLDLPDPKTVSLSLLYSTGFYKSLKRRLKPFGVVVTQATSPLYSSKAFLCILKSMRTAGFSSIPYWNDVPTLGQWGWVLGVKDKAMPEKKLKLTLDILDFSSIDTRFLTKDAMIAMTRFGKGTFEVMSEIEPNTEFNHIILKYYRQGDWEIY